MMRVNIDKKSLAASLAGFGLLFGAFGAVPAYADDDAPETTISTPDVEGEKETTSIPTSAADQNKVGDDDDKKEGGNEQENEIVLMSNEAPSETAPASPTPAAPPSPFDDPPIVEEPQHKVCISCGQQKDADKFVDDWSGPGFLCGDCYDKLKEDKVVVGTTTDGIYVESGKDVADKKVAYIAYQKEDGTYEYTDWIKAHAVDYILFADPNNETYVPPEEMVRLIGEGDLHARFSVAKVLVYDWSNFEGVDWRDVDDKNLPGGYKAAYGFIANPQVEPAGVGSWGIAYATFDWVWFEQTQPIIPPDEPPVVPPAEEITPPPAPKQEEEKQEIKKTPLPNCTPEETIPQTGDTFPVAPLLAASGAALVAAGAARRRND